jgi:hypothetical protein
VNMICMQLELAGVALGAGPTQADSG